MVPVDLVLSGSGVRLSAHFGAMLILRKRLDIKRIAGTSGGAIVAAAHCCHPNFESLWQLLKVINFNYMMCDGYYTSWIRLLTKNGLYKGNRVERFMDDYISFGLTLGDVPSLNVLCTDIDNQEPLVLSAANGYSNMKVSTAVRYSMSAPIYWVPRKLHRVDTNTDVTIVDGGISANYYIDLFNDHPRPTIGVSLYTRDKKSKPMTIHNFFRQIIATMMESNEREHIEDAYWSRTIKIDTGDIRPFDLNITPSQVEQLIVKGYMDTKNVFESKIEKEIANVRQDSNKI